MRSASSTLPASSAAFAAAALASSKCVRSIQRFSAVPVSIATMKRLATVRGRFLIRSINWPSLVRPVSGSFSRMRSFLPELALRLVGFHFKRAVVDVGITHFGSALTDSRRRDLQIPARHPTRLDHLPCLSFSHSIKEGNLARRTLKKSSGELANVVGDDQELIAVHAHDKFPTYRTDEFYGT